jgi:hypothetical protein
MNSAIALATNSQAFKALRRRGGFEEELLSTVFFHSIKGFIYWQIQAAAIPLISSRFPPQLRIGGRLAPPNYR